MSDKEIFRISALCRGVTKANATRKITDLAFAQHNLLCKLKDMMGLEPELGIAPTNRTMVKRLKEIMNDREVAWELDAQIRKLMDPAWDVVNKRWKHLPRQMPAKEASK